MASNIHLINCTDIIVNSDVENFIGIGLEGPRVIDNTYSNTVLNGSDNSVTITTSTTLNRSYHNKTVYLDASAGDITLTWDCINMNDVKISFIRSDATANAIYITDAGGYGTETFIGNAMPYDLALTKYEAIPLISKLDTIYINH